jgi:hypothetical protein
LRLNQIAALFERDKSVISRHLRNVYATAELDRAATVAFFAAVQDEGGRTVERQVEDVVQRRLNEITDTFIARSIDGLRS